MARQGLRVVLIAGAIGLIVQQAPNIWARYQIHRAEGQCARYASVPDWVVYEEDAAQVAKLRGNAGYTFEHRQVGPRIALFQAPSLTSLDRWTSSNSPSQMSGPGAMLFLHGLRTKGGSCRVVRVMYTCETGSFRPSFSFSTSMLDTGVGFRRPTWEDVNTDSLDSEFNLVFSEDAWRQQRGLTIYAGQIDPTDPARFSIRCHRGLQDGCLDGCLEDTASGPALKLVARRWDTMSPHVRVLNSQQLEQYSAPALEIVFEDEPIKAAQLLSSAASRYVTPSWLEGQNSAAALRAPSIWRNNYILYPNSPSKPYNEDAWSAGPVLFLGSRSNGAVNRVVRVDLQGSAAPSSNRVWPAALLVTVLSPGTIENSVSVVGKAERAVNRAPLTKPVRFYAGQCDAQDRSHFTIEYDYDGKAGTLHGWLLDGGVSVRLKGWPETFRGNASDEVVCGPGN